MKKLINITKKNIFIFFCKNYYLIFFLFFYILFFKYFYYFNYQKRLFHVYDEKYSNISNEIIHKKINKLQRNIFFQQYNDIFPKKININNIVENNNFNEKKIKKEIEINKKLLNMKNKENFIWNELNINNLIYKRINNISFFYKENTQKLSKNKIYYGNFIENYFDDIINNINLSKKEILLLNELLQYQINVKNLKKKDKFSIITVKSNTSKYKNDQFLGAHIYSQGKDFYIIKAKNGKYYDQKGSGLSINFMRFPIKKNYRISSNFNLHRLNPITGYVLPHNGIDFALPIGTPVLGVCNGEVIVTKKSNNAGNYITIKHDNNYITRYMHLEKILVKKGQIIKIGDKIALSGNTGRSTGPHLHYEIWINSKAVNPLIAKLPIREDLVGYNRKIYLQQAQKIISQLQFN